MSSVGAIGQCSPPQVAAGVDSHVSRRSPANDAGLGGIHIGGWGMNCHLAARKVADRATGEGAAHNAAIQAVEPVNGFDNTRHDGSEPLPMVEFKNQPSGSPQPLVSVAVPSSGRRDRKT